MKKTPAEIQQILDSISEGDRNAMEELFPVVYAELHRRASAYMRQERADHTLQPTALIHEVFLKLTKPVDNSMPDSGSLEDRHGYRDLNHFVATAALAMRRILVNHAKAKKTQKRGGEKLSVELNDAADAFSDSAIDLIALDEALRRLSEIDERQHRIVELRFFGGMTTRQCAEMLGMSERSVFYEWSHARAWLRSQIEGD